LKNQTLQITKVKDFTIRLPALKQDYYRLRTDEGEYTTALSIYKIKKVEK